MNIYVYRTIGVPSLYRAEFHRPDAIDSFTERSLGTFSVHVRERAWRNREEYPSETILVHCHPCADLAWFPGADAAEKCGDPMSEADRAVFLQLFARSKEEARRIDAHDFTHHT